MATRQEWATRGRLVRLVRTMIDYGAIATRAMEEYGRLLRQARAENRIEDRPNGWYRLDGKSVHGFPMLVTILREEAHAEN